MAGALGVEAYLALACIGNGLTDAQTETRALYVVVQLDEALEHLLLVFLGNTGTGVLAIDVETRLALALLLAITHANVALLGVLHGVGHEVGQHLLDAAVVHLGNETLQRGVLLELHAGVLHALGQRDAGALELLGKVDLGRNDIDAATTQ